MKQKILVLLVVVLLAIVVWLVVQQGGILHNQNNSPPDAQAGLRINFIKTAKPSRRDFSETRHWFGTVKSKNIVSMVALETGRVLAIKTRDNKVVKKGDTLFTMGGPLIDSRLTILRDKINTLNNRILLAKKLVDMRQSAVSQKLAKKQDLVLARDTLEAIKAQQETTHQQMQQLQRAINIKATMDGIFTNRRVSVGQQVQKGDILAELISLKDLYIEATVFPPNYILPDNNSRNNSLEGKQVIINLTGGNSAIGTIISSPACQADTGATVIWIRSDILGKILRPGASVNGTVILTLQRAVIAVPANAIVRDNKGQAYVFIKDKTGYHKRQIATGMISHDNAWLEIVSGLKPNDRVVVQGAYELFYKDLGKIFKVAD